MLPMGEWTTIGLRAFRGFGCEFEQRAAGLFIDRWKRLMNPSRCSGPHSVRPRTCPRHVLSRTRGLGFSFKPSPPNKKAPCGAVLFGGEGGIHIRLRNPRAFLSFRLHGLKIPPKIATKYAAHTPPLVWQQMELIESPFCEVRVPRGQAAGTNSFWSFAIRQSSGLRAY
jgi:hypothetical protein